VLKFPTFATTLAVASLGTAVSLFAHSTDSSAAPVALDSVVVTATRADRHLSDLPQSISVVSSAQIEDTPAVSLDDALRLTPSIDLPIGASYQLHPTGSGISMRGLGGIHALVLLDGVPLNDPFFGYVQWNRVPMESVERVEVVSGGGAPLWGNYAMGGVINIITKTPQQNGAVVDGAVGSWGTYRTYVGVSAVASNGFKVSVDYSHTHTDGYEQTPSAYLQAVSVPTSFTADNVNAKADFTVAPSLTADVKIDYHKNFEDLLTPVAVNTQRIWTFSGDLHEQLDHGTVTLSAFHDDSAFRVDTAGNTPGVPVGTQQFLQNRHYTPTNDTGGSLLWTEELSGWLRTLTLGGDYHGIKGTDTNLIFNSQETLLRTDVGRGQQEFLGAFAEASVKPIESLELLGSIRYEHYKNFDGYDGSAGGVGVVPDQSKNSVDPRLSVKENLSKNWAVRGAAYEAFRAPNLDELYRPFSSATGIQYANANLRPETLSGGELGFDFNQPGFRAQVTAYTNTIDHVITSESLPVSELPAGYHFGSRNINAGAARSRGVEAEATWIFGPAFSGTLGYNYADSIITDNPVDPDSVGQQIAGIPRQRVMASVTYRAPFHLRVTPQVRWLSTSYGDNDHTLVVPSHTVVDLSAAYPVNRYVELYVQCENLFDRSYISTNNGFQPPRLATPFTLLGGVHLTFN
jgi:outer membrane receptor protein involved in Fe transport